jgi:hypothetical protein
MKPHGSLKVGHGTAHDGPFSTERCIAVMDNWVKQKVSYSY